jgi:hypothetical protein
MEATAQEANTSADTGLEKRFFKVISNSWREDWDSGERSSLAA